MFSDEFTFFVPVHVNRHSVRIWGLKNLTLLTNTFVIIQNRIFDALSCTFFFAEKPLQEQFTRVSQKLAALYTTAHSCV